MTGVQEGSAKVSQIPTIFDENGVIFRQNYPFQEKQSFYIEILISRNVS